MIHYTSGGIYYIFKIFQCRGSVFPSALWVSMPAGLLTVALRILMDHTNHLDYFNSEGSILKETQGWSGFSFLVGFIIVFRTSQAYQRFWDGCTSTHTMRAEWFDACSALVAFCQYSEADVEEIMRFKHIVTRLFSMLHACALAELEAVNLKVESNVTDSEVLAFNYELLDPAGLDAQSIGLIKQSESRVELIFSWIQVLVVDNINSGVMSIPAPILSRAFQEIANGMVAFHDAVKLSYIPFPFPYAQTCDCLLCLHWLIIPWVVAQWVSHPAFGFIFVFIQVFILWSLNFIAVEIENPFGTDLNDLDGSQMQMELNRHLELLLAPETIRSPTLSQDATWTKDPNIVCFFDDKCKMSFQEVWTLHAQRRQRVMSMPAITGRQRYVEGMPHLGELLSSSRMTCHDLDAISRPPEGVAAIIAGNAAELAGPIRRSLQRHSNRSTYSDGSVSSSRQGSRRNRSTRGDRDLHFLNDGEVSPSRRARDASQGFFSPVQMSPSQSVSSSPRLEEEKGISVKGTWEATPSASFRINGRDGSDADRPLTVGRALEVVPESREEDRRSSLGSCSSLLSDEEEKFNQAARLRGIRRQTPPPLLPPPSQNQMPVPYGSAHQGDFASSMAAV